MPLTIIKGPPNSGRTEQVRREYFELLQSRPVLVVPGIDDIFDWERRLASEHGAFLGGRIMHFKDLVNEIVSGGGDPGRSASGIQRRHLIAQAIETGWPRISERVERQPGLIDAMLDLIDEFRNGRITPDALDEKISESGNPYLEKIAAVNREYLRLLDDRGLTDAPGLALEATTIKLDGWQGRPVFVAGFDDMTNSQLDLLERLAAQTDVTVALTHEVGNPAMAVTEKLLGRLEERGGTVRLTTDRPADPIDHDRLLFELERNFGLGRRGELVPGDALTIMRSSGRRGEAEAVAAEIARLVASGTGPGQIAIGVSSPATNGATFRDLLNEYGIAVTLESETPAAETATGQTIISLLRAVSPGGSVADLVNYLRGPVGEDQDKIDEVESAVLERGLSSASEAAGVYREVTGIAPPLWSELTAGNPANVTELITELSGKITDTILQSGFTSVQGSGVTTETQIATAISRTCAELESIQSGPVSTRDLADALTSGAITTWAIPTRNTVRIASPYSLRAKRFEYLFLVCLQERAFSDSGRAGPFLSLESRNTIGLPDFTDAELQELYLFYSCLSVPTKGLWLSSRIADESGKAEYPSPLVAGIEDLFDPALGPLRRVERPSSAVVFPADSAPSFNELVRTLATFDSDTRGAYRLPLDLSDTEFTGAENRIELAEKTELSTRTLAAPELPAALALVGSNTTFSATAIELFLSCPYRWFIERVLRPKRFGPDPEPMARGNLVHGVLAEIYGRHPHSLPRPEDLAEWTGQVESIVDEIAKQPGVSLGSDSAAHRVLRRKAANSISAFLKQESERESPGFLPLELEGKFGMGENSRPALEFDGWSLRGSIDRIDASGSAGTGVGQRGIVLDYKTGKSSAKAWAKIKREKKVQLQLYMQAIKVLWKVEPTAGLYVPIAGGTSAIRGVVDSGFAEDVADLNAQRYDREEEFAEAITDAIELSTEAVRKMLAGQIEHDPNTCPNHLTHAAVPDWINSDDGDVE